MLEPRKVAELLGGQAVLGRRIRSMADLQEAVEQGLPKGALRAIVRRLYPDSRAQRSAMHRIVPEATLKRRHDRLSLVESERTERLARIIALAEDVLGEAADARDFLTARHPLLGGRTPLEVARTDLGARRVEEILYSIEHGLPV